jgi:hypothetical protein
MRNVSLRDAALEQLVESTTSDRRLCLCALLTAWIVFCQLSHLDCLSGEDGDSNDGNTRKVLSGRIKKVISPSADATTPRSTTTVHAHAASKIKRQLKGLCFWAPFGRHMLRPGGAACLENSVGRLVAGANMWASRGPRRHNRERESACRAQHAKSP